MMKTAERIIKRAVYWTTPIYEKLPLWSFPEPQLRFKAYCVGAAKTGTVSLHLIFNNKCKSAHEAEKRFLIYKILSFTKGKMSEDKFIQYIKHRDKRLGLEMDSSSYNYFLVDILVKEFTEAKFILTIRDCYSWLDSLINHYLTYPQLYNWSRQHNVKLNEIRFKPDKFKHEKEERILADNGLYTVDGYFSYWAEHNNKIIKTVPENRLLILKTQEINQNISKIESFLGIPSGTLPLQVRGNTGTKKFNILSKIDKSFLEEKANVHCKELMDKYFPEII